MGSKSFSIQITEKVNVRFLTFDWCIIDIKLNEFVSIEETIII